MAQVRWLGLRVGDGLALFYIHQINRVNSSNDLVCGHDDRNIVLGIILLLFYYYFFIFFYFFYFFLKSGAALIRVVGRQKPSCKSTALKRWMAAEMR